MNELTPQQSTQNIESQKLPYSFGQRLIFGLFILAAPIFNFIFIDVMKPDWQSGKVSDYINLFLLPKASLLFFPLLTYSIICYLLLLYDTDRFAKSFFVRFGIYSGVFLALQYSILTIFALEVSPYSILVLLVYFSPVLITKAYRWLIAKWDAALIGKIALGAGIVVMIVCMLIWGNVLSPFVLLIFIIGIASPFWSFMLAGQLALWLLKNYESKFTLLRGLGLVAWLASYIYALRFNILKMYELYAALPPQPPDCYIATAAAKGHPQIVRSKTIRLENGNLIKVNSQLQHLKCLELAILAIAPKLHHWIRRVYDVVGRKLAVHIKNSFLADIAFLILVPVEWISLLVLKLLIPEIQIISKKFYVS